MWLRSSSGLLSDSNALEAAVSWAARVLAFRMISSLVSFFAILGITPEGDQIST